MKFKSKEVKGVTVIELTGNVMGGPDATALNDQLHKLIDDMKKRIVVDLSDVKFINSSG
ncbi:MAG: anti-sigma-factor antagonist, partial [Bacteroidetes bacterium]|nr:anti-sigma-factor antagonist [Bacteroidota bacterium]